MHNKWSQRRISQTRVSLHIMPLLSQWLQKTRVEHGGATWTLAAANEDPSTLLRPLMEVAGYGYGPSCHQAKQGKLLDSCALQNPECRTLQRRSSTSLTGLGA
jgi:hypothetical protein